MRPEIELRHASLDQIPPGKFNWITPHDESGQVANAVRNTIVVLTTSCSPFYVTTRTLSPRAAIAMADILESLGSVIGKVSDQNYDQSLAFYRTWNEIAQVHSKITPKQIFNAICANRGSGAKHDQLIHPTAHTILRFASDVESEGLLDPQFQSRLCARVLREFFEHNMRIARDIDRNCAWSNQDLFPVDANFIARWANLGYVEEATIHNNILQSLIYQPKLYNHQANALMILFKLAGATLAKYADPAVVDRCFELLKGYSTTKYGDLLQVCVVPCGERLSLG